MIQLDQIIQLAETELKEHPSRWRHTQHVAKIARKLALHYGLSLEKTLIAAYLHDITKYWPPEKAKAMILAYYSFDFMEQWENPTQHALSSAAYAQKLGIEDGEIIQAILYHPTGRTNMSLLDKILFVSDYAEETRSFENQEIAKTAFVDLNQAVYEILKQKISYIKRTSGKIMSTSLEAVEFYHNLLNGGME